MDAEDIVRALAADTEIGGWEEVLCPFCGIREDTWRDINAPHEQNCLWKQAREWVEEHPFHNPIVMDPSSRGLITDDEGNVIRIEGRPGGNTYIRGIDEGDRL